MPRIIDCPASSSFSTTNRSSSSSKLIIPIVYIFTIGPFTCKWFNFKDTHDNSYYIKYSVEQALLLLDKPGDRQRHPVILAANYRDCNHSLDIVKNQWHPDLVTIDYTTITTSRTRDFITYTDSLFMQSYMPELWSAAAIRFFVLEDVMVGYKYDAAMHVEGDNLLYGDVSATIRALNNSYPGMAATPLSKTLDFVTASVLWVGNRQSLTSFTGFMLRLGRRNGSTSFGVGGVGEATSNSSTCGQIFGEQHAQTHGRLLDLHKSHVAAKGRRIKMNTTRPALSDWDGFTRWLRPFACCVRGGGVAPDSEGIGLKPFAVNEMAMLAYYSYLTVQLHCPRELQFLPIVPPDLPVLAKKLDLMTGLLEMRFAAYEPLSAAANCTASTNSSISSAATGSDTGIAIGAGADVGAGASAGVGVGAGLGAGVVTTAPAWVLGDSLVGPDVLGGLFDPNSWGQYLGGTHKKRGKDKGFTDRSHLAWEVVWYYRCTPRMMCSRTRVSVRAFNRTEITFVQNNRTSTPTDPTGVGVGAGTRLGATSSPVTGTLGTTSGAGAGAGGTTGSAVYRDTVCTTAPFVNCWNATVHGHTPLWNLHVHSKHTKMYRSEPCDCATAV